MVFELTSGRWENAKSDVQSFRIFILEKKAFESFMQNVDTQLKTWR